MAANVSDRNGGRSKQVSNESAVTKNEAMHQEIILNRPIKSMKLFTEWDVENAAPNCIPRSCCLRVVRLEVFKALELDLRAVVICVAMQGSRRSLRSDQIPLQSTGMLDVELDLVFTLQYPHFLKRRENRLQIMLQRRKKYKTRTILGYKTFAVGRINMAQVLQGWCPKQIHLYIKNEENPVATITIANLSSEPIDREITDRHGRRTTIASMTEQLNTSDEEGDDDSSSSDIEDSAGELEGVEDGYRRQSSRRRKESSRNFKQKIIRTLFRKLRATDEALGDVHNLEEELQEECLDADNEFLFDDDEDDSDNDMLDDNTSIASVQRPGLRPYFDQNKSQITLNQNTLTREEAKELRKGFYSYNTTDSNEDEGNANSIDNGEKARDVSPENSADADWEFDDSYLTEPPFIKNSPRSLSFRERRQKVHVTRKRSVDLDKNFKESGVAGFNDQLSVVLGTDDTIPDYVLMVGLKGEAGQHLAIKLMARLEPVICTSGTEDVQATIAAIVSRFQKFCNRHSNSPPNLKIGVIGPESYLRVVVRSYVEQFSLKSQEYQNYVKFLIIPSGNHRVASYIGQLDIKYQSLFMDNFWKGLFDHGFVSENDAREVEGRILQYIENAVSIHSIPIAEALITFKSNDGESSQDFVPFINEVRLGSNEACNSDTPENELVYTNATFSPKEGGNGSSEKHAKDAQIVPSPRIETTDIRAAPVHVSSHETLDLVVDYWPVQYASVCQNIKKEEKKEVNKLTIKSTFRTLCVSRLPSNNEDSHGLLFSANMKNRNKGVKRLMKQRDKDSEAKSSVSAVVSKIVCTARSSGQTFNAVVDGKEWNNVKFFSLSSQWPTHIKQFPLGMFLNYGYKGS